MRYEVSERVQSEKYCCNECFLADVIATLFDESLNIDQVDIITDRYKTAELIKLLSSITVNGFEFELAIIDFNIYEDAIDEYKISITNDGEVYVESAINKDAEYHECYGFMFVDESVSQDAYEGNNALNDVMVFEILE